MKIKVIQPDYYKSFKCIGSDCRNNCCNIGWDIHIDKNTYKKYKNIPKSNLFSSDLKKYVKVIDKQGKRGYAKLVRTSDEESTNKGCIFQSQEGLCRIHSELGEEYLSDTCKIYPRALNYCAFTDKESNCFEKSCNISCEEVANIFLNKEDYIEYEILEEKHSKNYITDNLILKVENIASENKRKIIEYYSEIKSIIIAILQNRDYSFEDRLILMAIFCEKLDNIEAEGNVEAVSGYITNFIYAVDNKLYDSLLNTDSKSTNDMSYVFSFLMLDMFIKISEEKTIGLDRIYKNIKLRGILTVEDYRNSDFNKNFKKFAKHKEVFIEHIFVNEAFSRIMPFYREYGIFENAQILISLYSLYRIILSGYLGDSDNISDEELVDATAYFGKFILHSNMIFEMLINTMKETKKDTLANMIVLIKG